MIRPLVVFLALGLAWMSAPAADDKKPAADDPIAAELTKAKEEYQEAVKEAGEKLVAAFAAQQKKLEENTKLKVAEQIKQVEQIQEERKAFEADPAKLPKSAGMKVAVSDYQTKTTAAKKKCEAAFDKAAESYRGKKDLPAAKAVLAEKGQFFKGAEVGDATFRVPLPTRENSANAGAFIKLVLAPACKAGAVTVKGAKPGVVTITVAGSTQTYSLADGTNWAETIGIWINDNMAKNKRCDPLKSKDELKDGKAIEISKP